jgi:dephospho-CoA kinase
VTARLGLRGFRVHSLSDVVRAEAELRGLPPEREHLIRIGNDLRRRLGPGILAERILPRIGGRDVVDSIRNPHEVEVLRRLPRFVLIGVHAPVQCRFRRSVGRGRPGDPVTLEAFVERERQENSGDPGAQQLEACFLLADRVLVNAGTLEELRSAVDRLVDELDAGAAA